MTKKVFFIAVVGVLLLTGCSKKNVDGQNSKQLTFAIAFQTTYLEFFANMQKGMEAAAEEFNVKLVTSDANSDSGKQYNTMENFIQQKVDGIVLMSVDPDSMIDVTEQAVNAGIPVITIDRVVNTPKVSSFLGSDSKAMGIKCGEAFKAYCQKNNITSAEIGITTAFRSTAQPFRVEGFKEILETMGPGFVIINIQNGDSRDTALISAENILQANPEIDFLFGTNEGNTLGCYDAVKMAGKSNAVKVFGVDITNDIITGIENDEILFVVTQNPYLIGYTAIESLMKIHNGESLPEVTYVDAPVVSKDNIAEYVR
jgi:ribose transport system substrate-binding protein